MASNGRDSWVLTGGRSSNVHRLFFFSLETRQEPHVVGSNSAWLTDCTAVTSANKTIYKQSEQPVAGWRRHRRHKQSPKRPLFHWLSLPFVLLLVHTAGVYTPAAAALRTAASGLSSGLRISKVSNLGLLCLSRKKKEIFGGKFWQPNKRPDDAVQRLIFQQSFICHKCPFIFFLFFDEL